MVLSHPHKNKKLSTHSFTINQFSLIDKLKDYGVLTKFKLSGLVVFSAAMTYLLADNLPIRWGGFVLTIIGGWLVTASSNAFNQIIERDLDKMMNRTMHRPLPTGRMQKPEAIMVALITGIAGVLILSVFINLLTGMLAAFSLLSYVLLYTPLKRITPLSVFVGAIPGALPAMLGYTAATNQLTYAAWVVFFIQFFWQFPHFWAIAWVMDDDYKKAGFIMLPTTHRDKGSALQTLLYALALLPVIVLPYIFNISGVVSLVIIALLTLWFIRLAFLLYQTCTIEAARKLMFGSFVYLPVTFIALVLDKYLF